MSESSGLQIATVGAKSGSSATLIFPGETSMSNKRYKIMNSATVAAGDMVVIAKISGTYIILGKVPTS